MCFSLLLAIKVANSVESFAANLKYAIVFGYLITVLNHKIEMLKVLGNREAVIRLECPLQLAYTCALAVVVTSFISSTRFIKYSSCLIQPISTLKPPITIKNQLISWKIKLAPSIKVI